MLLYSLQPDDTRYPMTQPESIFDLIHEASPWADAEFSEQVRVRHQGEAVAEAADWVWTSTTCPRGK